jgi:YegS/Rv2252/BmrU family lipid kinase
MASKIILLLNPISGIANKAGLRAMLENRLRNLGVEYEFMDTDPTGKYEGVREKVEAESISRIVIIGGDGTVSHTTAALRDLPIEFALIPAGSGNGLARAANIPTDPLLALELAISGTASPIDAFTINDDFSCMLSGIGFDAQVAHDFAKMKKRGLWTYVRISAGNFFDAVEYPFTLKLDGKEIPTEAYFISIANGNQFGNNFTIAPKAMLNDGLLDIIVVQKMSKLQVLMSVFYQMKYGEVQEERFRKDGILYYQARELEIINPKLAPLHIDGDPVATAEALHIKIIPGAIRLVH